MQMGRPNKGADHVDALDAEQHARERLRLVLLTLCGELSNEDAAGELGIGPSQLANLRTRALQGAVDALAPLRPGRPRKHDVVVDQRVRALQAKVAALEKELQQAQVREQLALAAVPLRTDPAKGGSITVKKSPPQRRRR